MAKAGTDYCSFSLPRLLLKEMGEAGQVFGVEFEQVCLAVCINNQNPLTMSSSYPPASTKE